MSATIRATSSAATALSADKTVTVTKPAATANDDLLLAFFAVRQVPGIITPPVGWEEIGVVDVLPGDFMKAYRRIAKTEPADYTWTWVNDAQAAVTMVALNVHDGHDVVVGTNTASGTSHKTDSIFTTEPAMLLLAAYMINIQTTFTPPATFVENEDVQSGASNGISMMLCNKVQATKGQTGQFAAVSVATETGAAFIVSVRDPAVTETFDPATGVKTNILNATNVSAGVQILTAEPGQRQSLNTIFISAAGATSTEVRIEDSAGRILLPNVAFNSNVRTFGPVTFEKGISRGGVGKAIKVVGTGSMLVSTQIKVDVIS